MSNDLVVTKPQAIATSKDVQGFALMSALLEGRAKTGVFEEYHADQAPNTLRAQVNDLATFGRFLGLASAEFERLSGKATEAPTGQELYSSPDAWALIGREHVKAFRSWLLEGADVDEDGSPKYYAISTINRMLATVRKYAALAMDAGAIDPDTYALICAVKGFNQKQAKRRNDAREESRIGSKKADPTWITREDAQALKAQGHKTPQARRDSLMLAILVDLGLRASEVAALKVSSVSLERGPKTPHGKIVVFQPKTGETDNKAITADIRAALEAYIAAGDCPEDQDAPLLRQSRKDGSLGDPGMSPNSISLRVRRLGEELGIARLSSHDLRHYCAEKLTADFGPERARRAMAWKSSAMIDRYVDRNRIVNEGMV